MSVELINVMFTVSFFIGVLNLINTSPSDEISSILAVTGSYSDLFSSGAISKTSSTTFFSYSIYMSVSLISYSFDAPSLSFSVIVNKDSPSFD